MTQNSAFHLLFLGHALHDLYVYPQMSQEIVKSILFHSLWVVHRRVQHGWVGWLASLLMLLRALLWSSNELGFLLRCFFFCNDTVKVFYSLWPVSLHNKLTWVLALFFHSEASRRLLKFSCMYQKFPNAWRYENDSRGHITYVGKLSASEIHQAASAVLLYSVNFTKASVYTTAVRLMLSIHLWPVSPRFNFRL